jgi:UDPglucose 6-dehydrogenase
MKLSVFGIGKLGAPLAACFAARGFEVIGVDIDLRKIEAIRKRRAPVYEPGLQSLINRYGGYLAAAPDGISAVHLSEITFVVVPTPNESGGGFSLKFVLDSCKQIAKALKEKDDYHLVVITSTVMPGSMERVIQPQLEEVSGKRAGSSFGLCYNPEFIALGSVIQNFLNPDFILIGESDARSGDKLAGLYKKVCENKPPIARMNFINAELTKLALNAFVTTKITFANTLARICEKLPGADVDVVTSALGHDSRIGGKYLKGGISYGGPCFPRDNKALTVLAGSVGIPALLAEATDTFNRQQISFLVALVREYLPRDGKVGILGLAYKPDTDVVEEAQGLILAQVLRERDISVIAYDPAATENARFFLDKKVSYSASAEECIEQADVVVVTTPWDEFKRICRARSLHRNSLLVIIDCWRILDRKTFGNSVKYIALGKSPKGMEADREV